MVEFMFRLEKSTIVNTYLRINTSWRSTWTEFWIQPHDIYVVQCARSRRHTKRINSTFQLWNGALLQQPQQLHSEQYLVTPLLPSPLGALKMLHTP